MPHGGSNDRYNDSKSRQAQKYVTQQVDPFILAPHVDIFCAISLELYYISKVVVARGHSRAAFFVTIWPPRSHTVVANLLRTYLTDLFRLEFHVFWKFCSH
jgi:hypothetical protein